jgi:catechol 2,3-dioxygenase-like lactoylglutathione lyase family enzyme
MLAFVQAPAPRVPITGIDHIALAVSDAAAARAFYQNVLGLELVRVSRGDAYSVGHRQRILVEGGLRPDEDERLRHLAFATSDLEAIDAALRRAGFAPSAVEAPDCGGRVLRVTDPDGHTIEFVQRGVRDPASASKSPALSSRILHAGLIVQRAEAADRFYKDALGFSEIWRGGRTDAETDWINMRVPEGTDYVEYMLVRAAVDRRQRGVLHHMALLVPDIQEAYESALARTPPARRAGVAPPNVGRNRRWQLNLYDPDGTRTELMEPHTMK